MLVSADLDRFVVFNNRVEEDEGVVLMVKEECDSIVDVEEGEISDTDSVKEISEKDFVKQQVSAATTTKNSVGNSNNASANKPRVWTMQELCSSYSMSPNYSGLVNFAWARAVQNKPLEEVNVMDIQSDEEKPPSVSGKEDNKVVIDEEDEKEEGELEEGEIDLDGDVEQNEGLNLNDMNAKMENGFQRRVNSIRNELQTVTVIEADKSFESVCSRLQKSLDSLHEVISEKSASSVDDLVHLSFAAIQTLNSVLSSMDQNRRDKNKETLRRLLNFLAKQVPPVFLPGQMIEIELMMRSLEHVTSAKTNLNDFDAPKNDQLMRVTESANNLSNKDDKDLMEQLKSGHGSYRGRGMLLPLLDLHKDHDEDSLPSPTGATPLLLPVSKPVPIGGGPVKPEWPVRQQVVENQQPVMHPYETDAVRAVSTYQQRFSLSSFVMNDLPSPTPSEDGNDGEGDTGGEVSSSSISGRVSNVNAPIVNHSVVSSGLPTDMSVSQGLNYFKISGPVAPEPATAPKSLTRNRDPRLRFANPDIGNSGMTLRTSLVNKNDNVDVIGHLVSSRKQKNMEEPRSDGPALKRQRNVLEDSEVSGDVQTVSKTGGWLDDTGGAGYNFGVSRRQMVDNLTIEPPKYTSSVSSMAMPNVTSVKDHLSLTGASDTSLLQSLLNNIAVNPTMLASLLNTEHQNTANPATSSPHMTNISSSLGAFPPVDVSFPNPPVSAPVVSGIPQTPRAASMDEDGNACMKPRDPRRVLRKNTLQKGGNLVPDQMKTSAAMISSSQEMKGIQTYKKQEDQSNRMAMSSQCITPPDITQQFTKNLKNIADIMCGPQVSMAPAVVTHIPSSQPWLNNSDKADVKVVTPELSISSSGAASSTEEVVLVAAQPQKTWGDVEHLFEGFDDQQKAAIHKERARRMEEQRKMFDARKLCLVLDLDHTLLNSAKFSEVDPAHDEILRKKEEQDREKPYRHLFRFPHMGMWTKLRPGVWNFLEKASKLFEMHLYTMGNKLYATEMAKLLDPKGVLFNGRVISRGDDNDLIDGDERVPKIKDLDGVLGMESDVVIIDDSIRVWPHNKLNLIAVERYIYFPCSRRQFGLLGPSLLEIDHDERPEDGTLASSLAVIERIHQNFFAHESLEEADVRNILASEQRKILGGCRIVFSRVFPVGQASPHLHPLWQTAEQFGAVCTNQIDDQVTHVVANSMGTDKVNWALSTGRFVVHPGWVEASALLYRRANENDFAVKS